MTLTKGWYVVEHSPRKALTFWCRRTSAVLYIFVWIMHFMMTPTNGNSFRVADPLCGEFTGHRWIPLTKASDAELWWFFICAWINGWVNNREAGDVRRHRAHYDVTVMLFTLSLEYTSLEWMLTATIWHDIYIIGLTLILCPLVSLKVMYLSLTQHYSHATWTLMCFKSSATRLFRQQLALANRIKRYCALLDPLLAWFICAL